MSETAELVAGGKNAIIDKIKEKMGTCPYFGTKEILDEVMIQKESWGGKKSKQNTTRLSSLGNFAYVKWAERNDIESNREFGYYEEMYKEFLSSIKPEVTEKHLKLLRLKFAIAMRIAFLDEKNAMQKRISNVGKALDLYYPIDEAYKVKALEKFRKENEPLLEELQKGFSWQNMMGYATAGMGYVQKSVLEPEIKQMVKQYEIWKQFGAHIPGFGEMTCAYMIAKLQDPTRFSDSGKVRAFCGVAPKGGKPMKAKRGETLGYDPGMKELLCKIFPDSFMKVSGNFPDDVYSQFFQACRTKQAKKAVETTPEKLADKYKVPVENITNLGFEPKKDKEGNDTGELKFSGFSVKKLDGTTITTLNPGHVLQRAMREFGSMFISDFYHMWLHLEGENPRIEGNPRIMAVLAKAKEQK